MNLKILSPDFSFRITQNTSMDAFSASLQLYKPKTLTFNIQQVQLAKRLRKRLREGSLWIE